MRLCKFGTTIFNVTKIMNFTDDYLPFCVLTGSPDVRVPATESALATVDIFIEKLNQLFNKILFVNLLQPHFCVL